MNELTIRITDIDSAMKVAGMLAKSGYWKETATAEKAFVKIMLGMELGIGPLASMRGIEIDYLGRVTLMANLQAALVKASGRFDYHLIEATDSHCAVEFLERNPNAKSGDADEWRLLGISELTIDQAKAANMHMQWDKDEKKFKLKQPWASYPSDMLFARCITRGVKRYVPHITNGLTIYDPDELQGLPPSNVIEGESRTVETQPPFVPDQPATTSATTQPATTETPAPTQKEAHAESSSGNDATQPKPTDQQVAIEFWKHWANKLKALVDANTHPEHRERFAGVKAVNGIKTNMAPRIIIDNANRIMIAVCGATGEVKDELPNVGE
jgi:hypothetical protein